MRRLALLAAAVLLRAAPAAADPLDVNIWQLGAPSAGVWQNLAAYAGTPITQAQAQQLAGESVARYRLLALQLGLGLTSFMLEDPTSGGRLGFAVGLEGAVAQIKHETASTSGPTAPILNAWPVRGPQATSLRMSAFHVQKPLPYGVELGGRLIYVDRSQMTAGQVEIRWVVNENWSFLPDFALRGAVTRLIGQRDLELSVIDADAVVGKRFGLLGTLRVTPYGAVRVSAVAARTTPVDFGPTAYTCATSNCFPDTRPPGTALGTIAPFPDMKFRDNRIVRWTLGTKLQASALTLVAEGIFQDIKTFAERDPGVSLVKLPRSYGGSLRLGFDF